MGQRQRCWRPSNPSSLAAVLTRRGQGFRRRVPVLVMRVERAVVLPKGAKDLPWKNKEHGETFQT